MHDLTSDPWSAVSYNLNGTRIGRPRLISRALYRAYTISRKNRYVGIVLLSGYILATAVSTTAIPV